MKKVILNNQHTKKLGKKRKKKLFNFRKTSNKLFKLKNKNLKFYKMKNKEKKIYIKKIKQKKKNSNSNKKCFSFLITKTLITKFLINAKFMLGPSYSPSLTTSLFVGLIKSKVIFNIFLLLRILKITLHEIYLLSHWRELIIITGAFKEFKYLTQKISYTLDPWIPGFLTNFMKLTRQTLVDRLLNIKSKRHLADEVIVIKLKPQIPTYMISFFDHWPSNEARKLHIPSYVAISNQFNNFNQYFTIPINKQKTSIAIYLLLIKEAIIIGKLEEKFFFSTK